MELSLRMHTYYSQSKSTEQTIHKNSKCDVAVTSHDKELASTMLIRSSSP